MPHPKGQERSPRPWGYWTEHKLSMLSEYLKAFTRASTKARRTLYLDLFAGTDQNISRSTGVTIDGSPRVALNTQPPFTKAVLFELPHKASGLHRTLEASYPGRDFVVVPGDCNDMIGGTLEQLTAEGWDWAPTFAMVDQQAAEVRWATLEQLARFKRPSKPKAELWLLFAPSMLPRGLAADDPEAVMRFDDRVSAMYGTEEWRTIYEARRRELISPSRLRDELLNLMRWRLENVLGYKVTHSFEMKNTNGGPIYSMIFATDHTAGEKIMRHIYGKAAAARPKMQAEAERLRRLKQEAEDGILALFEPLARPKPDELYEHQPPTAPYRLQGSK